ncbi:hypothetical protein A2671_00815 [Candidatus Kaiserbacteria bacterium RIFCSPHIGHO2_01_FULL_49_13]|uniref:AP2/ERF domain-containing protein n=1 Tax=Candidatus Kaiserbacteria bacterium RIFCSPHIGHO2_01_FULL_49_13 TaxID=1798477 RepID=A0A1F6CD20_9BACT|nr:MAG: hypothetical protein A2671_00815 [Candidatus Kaiserbacteria bacterium RIFCSPHIGHO2_01_FULL_49_13]
MAASHTPSERGGLNLEIPADDLSESIRVFVVRNPGRNFLHVPTPEELAIEPGPGERIIHLTRGYTTIVDAEDYAWLSVHKWTALVQKKHCKIYAVRSGKKAEGALFRTMLYMHREIIEGQRRKKSRALSSQKPVDHKTGNSLDNRRYNLKPGKSKFNQFSRRLRKKSTSRYRGVSLVNTKDAWQARISLNHKAYHLGIFDLDKEIEAARAYDKKARRLLRGLDPRFLALWLNFPDAPEKQTKKIAAKAVVLSSAEADIPF